ncbi:MULTISPECIES: KamA family radical SAM protein [Alistipes]|uniref:KamA family protein n=1 Tax=Alistipes senegalensis JC50 TaxID=1033732 RepID=A0ABY5V4R7_9BACT|nr:MULTISPECIES: KamA family protein [Alistipes]MBR2218201.1 KamA family protein [Alistipes sp.]MDY4570731.1 KamA family protein [Alistipes senegalensis]UEA88499.1 KamA family protein [Alistipes senegalensis]UWN63909.1 KamA family protein [Alistipes senegalensis JC50]
MKQKKMLALTLSQLGLLYRQELPDLAALADACCDGAEFRMRLGEFVDRHAAAESEAAEQIRLLIGYDGQEVHELSTDCRLEIQTLTLLWQFLTGRLENPEMPSDLFVDLFHLFRLLDGAEIPLPSPQRVRSRTERWPSGLDEAVRAIRADNRERMLHLLVQKIENRKSKTPSRYRFAEGMTYDEKYRQVAAWWDDFRFQLAMAVKSPSELNRFLAGSLSSETMYLLSKARKKGMPFFATPYYLSLLDVTGDGYDDAAIRSYILYSPQLVETYGRIRAWEREDVVEAGKPNAAGWLLPDGHNIHRRYPEVAILIPDTMGRACGGLCASCQRMYDFQSERLNFEFEALRPKESWDHKLRRLMNYFEEDTQLRDILITGGDALMSQNKTLRNMLEAVYRMACRKRRANAGRPDGEKYAELQRVRLGSRLPAYLPMRVNDELVEILREFREKASAVGVKQFIVQTHFQTPLEVTPEAEEAIRKILSAGWLITNQLVYTVAASRRGHTARLRQVLNSLGVVCYYTFSVKGFEENRAVFTPNSRSMQEQVEEKVYGRLTAGQASELDALLADGRDTAAKLRRFMRKYRLPFLATDRSVLNLPAIGKSMTFRLVGLTPEGRRILRFDHDRTRRHSPIIDRMGEIFIVESKSVAAYLRQIGKMGEDPEDYASIWAYTRGETEPRFGLYEYPGFDFGVTGRMSNLEL